MQYTVTDSLDTSNTECLVVGVFQDNPTIFASKLDTALNTLIETLSSKFTKSFSTLWHYPIGKPNILLINLGTYQDYTQTQLNKYLQEIADDLIKHSINSAFLLLPEVEKSLAKQQLTHTVIELEQQFYQLTEFKQAIDVQKITLNAITIYSKATLADLSEALAIAQGIKLARYLADLPANVCTPTYLADKARTLAHEHSNLTTHILDIKDLKSLNMNAFLAVAQGSKQTPCLIEMHYQGSDSAPIVLVGKGITFDSGGLSLKPANMMDEMKYDMAGAATVLGVMKTCALLNLPLNLIGLAPCTENMPDGGAVKPGDIIRTASGQTVEILNTDAEGRLILADALSYAEKFNPQQVIDIATLTGAMVVALGSVYTGFMTADEALARAILQASQESGDLAWRMPLHEKYQKALESPLADMINAAFDRSAGAITAACFLSRFTKKYTWAHLDIAGSAWISGKKRQATGRPVGLLVQLLKNVSYAS